MPRAIPLALSLGTTLLVAVSCDDPTRPDPDAQLARATLADGPTYISTGPVSTSEIAIGWDDNSRNEGGFELHRSTTGPTGTFALLAKTAANVTAYNDGGLTQGAQYCYKVRSFKVSGRTTSVSAFTEVTCSRTLNPPPAPTGLTAVPAPGGFIDLTWTQPTSTVNGFRIERSTLPAGPWETIHSALSGSPYRDSGRPAETQACYRVIAFNNDGSSPPSAADCTTPPAAPTALTAASRDAQSIELVWTDNSAVEDGFEIQRSSGDGTWSAIATPPADATAYVDAGLPTDTRFFYRVRARKDGGWSEFTAAASALIVGTLPPAPTALDAYSYNSTVTYMSWSSSAPNVESFRVERSTDGRLTWQTIQTLRSGARGASDDGRTPNEEVCYRVFAVNRIGESPASNSDCVIPPAAVTDLVAAPAGEGSIVLTWSNPAPGIATEFSLMHYEWIGGYPGYCYNPYGCYPYQGWVEVARVPAGVTSHTVSGYSPDQLHEFVIVTLARDASADPSPIASSLTEPPPPPATNVTATVIAPGSVEVRWTDNAGDDVRYAVQRCAGTQATCTSSDFWAYENLPAHTVTWTDVGLQPGVTYTYRVLTIDGAAVSVSANMATVTMPSMPE